jgi:two-component system KDP operon response regulator KdpE
MPDAPLLLIVDDEPPIRKFLRASLTGEGYRVAEAETGDAALKLASRQPPDLVLLDLGLPDIDGLEVITALRQWSSAPIVVLSARGQERSKVAALDAGADDYLTKPFGIEELLARIRVALRHASRIGRPGEEESRLTLGDLTIDLASREVRVAGEEVRLTKLEFRLLSLLAQHAGKVLTHRFLLKEVWGPHAAQENHYLRVFMASLRRKIEADPAQPRYLITEQGVGYRLAVDDAQTTD